MVVEMIEQSDSGCVVSEAVPAVGRIRAFGRRARAFWTEQAGLTVSAIVLIGILVVATVAFGAIAANKIAEAGTEVENVDFGG
ncbi:MAG: hypothetical protein R2761_03030 [Acidimicrobiales bacterium]